MTKHPQQGYGKCPQCGAEIRYRERCPNGNDICYNGHVYPSKDTVPYPEDETKFKVKDKVYFKHPECETLILCGKVLKIDGDDIYVNFSGKFCSGPYVIKAKDLFHTCSECFQLPKEPVKKEPMTDFEYLANGGAKCPFCHSEHISSGGSSVEGNETFVNVTCEDCGEVWEDQYKLVGYCQNTAPQN